MQGGEEVFRRFMVFLLSICMGTGLYAIAPNQKTVLVCGGGGFIGYHLMKQYKSEGYWVRGADLHEPQFGPNVADEFLIADLRDPQQAKKALFLNGRSFDEVCQLAANMGGMGFISQHDAEIMHDSALINLNVLEESRKTGAKKVFFSSSACVYPLRNQLDPDNPKCSEDSAYPADPDTEYGWEKLFSERLYLSYMRDYGMDIRIARLHNVFGPQGTWEGGREKAPAALCRKVAQLGDEGRIDIWGKGDQTRSFLYIDECVEGIRRILSAEKRPPIVNLGSEEMIQINDLALLIGKISGKDVAIQNVPGPEGVRGRNSDNSLIRSVLDWEPTRSLEAGLKSLYPWVASQIEEKQSSSRGQKITVIGIGKIGLCYALCLERAGYRVLGVDLSQEYTDSLNRKTFRSLEPQVNEYLKDSRNFEATTSLKEGLDFSDVCFIAVPTNHLKGTDAYDPTPLTQLLQAIDNLEVSNKHLVISSTVPPGYIEKIGLPAIQNCKNTTLSYNPEFIAQGQIIGDLENPDVVLIGADSKEDGDILEAIQKKLCKNQPSIERMSTASAQIAKMALNCFVTAKIAFANLIGDIADETPGADKFAILGMLGKDSRVGSKYLKPGYGFGGPCFPRDNRAFAEYAASIGIETTSLRATDRINRWHTGYMAEKLIEKSLDEYAFEDVCYKSNCPVPIIEESQKIAVAKQLAEAGKKVTLIDSGEVLAKVEEEYGTLFNYQVKQ